MAKQFDIIVKDRPAPVRRAAAKLRRIIFDSLGEIEENIYGGQKVQNALYSKNGPRNVVCGIQTNDKYCVFYLHKTGKINTEGLKIEGSGKHAKHVKFFSDKDIEDKTIERVLADIYEQT